jgi:hypothetical protein
VLRWRSPVIDWGSDAKAQSDILANVSHLLYYVVHV